MSILVYGGGFDPPHLGHLAAADRAYGVLRPDRFLVIPDGIPPHKPLPPEAPDAETRLDLCRIAFQDRPWAEVLDFAIRRDGPSYMIDTVEELEAQFPEETIVLLLGTDMLLCFESWRGAKELMARCTLAALCRGEGERDELERKAEELRHRYGARVQILEHGALPLCSSQIRAELPRREGRASLSEACYREIVRRRLYGAQPDLDWLMEQVRAMLDPGRIAHVEGCAETAQCLARRWCIDPDMAREAGILHDCTKAWSNAEQLRYCDEMGVELDPVERQTSQLLHARTGAVAARSLFGATEDVCDAIRWHTTGKADMDSFEMILYLADKIEPTRHYPGVDRIRALAMEDLSAAMKASLGLTVEDIRRKHRDVYKDTLDACQWYSARVQEIKEEPLC